MGGVSGPQSLAHELEVVMAKLLTLLEPMFSLLRRGMMVQSPRGQAEGQA